jgi:transposase-like protein
MANSINEEVKSQVLKRIRDGGSPVSQVAVEYGLNPRTIYAWLSKTAIEGSGLILEVGRLKKENRLLFELVGKLMLEKEKRPFKKN